jgi:hypothetical protein
LTTPIVASVTGITGRSHTFQMWANLTVH